MGRYIVASIDVEAEISFDDPSLCSPYCSFCQEIKGKHKCHLKGVFGVPVDVNAPEILERVKDLNDPDKDGLKRTDFCLKFFHVRRIKEDKPRKRKSALRSQSVKKRGGLNGHDGTKRQGTASSVKAGAR